MQSMRGGWTRSTLAVVCVHGQRLSGPNPQRASGLPAEIAIRPFGLSVDALPGLVFRKQPHE
jgi:hypothetical protein